MARSPFVALLNARVRKAAGRALVLAGALIAQPWGVHAQDLGPDAGPSVVEDAGVPVTDAAAPLSEGDAGESAPESVADAAVALPVSELPVVAAPPVVAPAEAPVPAEAPALEVVARSKRSEARRLQESAEAVTVVDTRKARQQSADLGEVLARTQGVGVRRDGGLGSNATISLNGLQDEQVRIFLDGVPLRYAGFPFGLANIPVSLVERIEIYRGVVPIRFGADALGGSINVVTDPSYETHAGASYQVGSFGTHRATANGRYRHEGTGLVLGANAFVDSARNDYMMDDRQLSTKEGRTIVQSVRRNHDAYRAYGGNVEVGVVDRKWARRLILQGFAATYDKELQHNAVMTLPYGEIEYGETLYGATLRYEVELTPKLEFDVVANYAHRIIDFEDKSTHKYQWNGERGRMLDVPGEQGKGTIDRSFYEDSVFARALATWTLARGHIVRFSVAPQFATRIGDDHVKGRKDLLKLRYQVMQLVGGVEYESNFFDDKLSNVAFGKAYYQDATAEDRKEFTGNILERSREAARLGAGDALRYRFTPWLLAKASYEYATRLPSPDELFGNGVLIDVSTNEYRPKPLRPEVSHNVNLGPRFELKRTQAGDFMLDVNGFLRDVRDQITLLAGKAATPYANIANTRIWGVENASAWQSPGRWVSLEGSFTWLDARNNSTKGAFRPMKGLRIPTRPYMFASWGGRVRVAKLPGTEDALEPFYYGRWVHAFNRSWDIGNPDINPELPAQISHNVGLTYLCSHRFGKLASTFEVSNLSDARLFDVFGVQRAGRGYYLKVNGQF